MSQPPVFTQNTLREGFVEFAFGEPDPALLPVGLVREAAARALGAEGAAALAYGSSAGPAALRAAIARAHRRARRPRSSAESDVLVSGGISQALDQVLTVLAAPGDVVFVECPTYNLALGIIADHPVDVVGVPLDAEGLDVDALAAAVRDVARVRPPPPAPLHHPDLPQPGRREPLGASAQRSCSSSPGARISCSSRTTSTASSCTKARRRRRSARWTRRRPSSGSARSPSRWRRASGWAGSTPRPPCASGWRPYGTLESGGCVSQFSAHVVAALLAAGAYAAHVAVLRHAYASRRDALAAALRDHLPAGCAFTVPAGGFFLWVTLPPGLTASRLLPVAERHARRVRSGRAVLRRRRRPQPAARLQPLRRGEPRRGRPPARRRRDRGCRRRCVTGRGSPVTRALTSRRAPRLRTGVAAFLVVASVLAVLVSALALWTHGLVFDTDTYVGVVAPVLDDPEAREGASASTWPPRPSGPWTWTRASRTRCPPTPRSSRPRSPARCRPSSSARSTGSSAPSPPGASGRTATASPTGSSSPRCRTRTAP